MAWSAQQIRDAQIHLRKRDPIMREVIKAVGPFTLKPQRDRFRVLVQSIISQQISTAAANTILHRLTTLVGQAGLTPTSLQTISTEQLRSCGLSSRKSDYLLDLVHHVSSKAIELETLGKLSDEQIIERLTQVKGIGRWTAQMFLIFSLGRLDVLAHDDLGLKTAIKRLYNLDELPTRSEFEACAAPWRPYASVACWYCWRALEQPVSQALASQRVEGSGS